MRIGTGRSGLIRGFEAIEHRSLTRRGVFAAVLFAVCGLLDASGSFGEPLNLQLAYLDPGSGSFMIQALVAALAGIAVTLRTYWSKIRSFFGASPPDSEDDDPVVNTGDE
jgi:hypothetical protein